jgi:hypothetical protein
MVIMQIVVNLDKTEAAYAMGNTVYSRSHDSINLNFEDSGVPGTGGQIVLKW